MNKFLLQPTAPQVKFKMQYHNAVCYVVAAETEMEKTQMQWSMNKTVNCNKSEMVKPIISLCIAQTNRSLKLFILHCNPVRLPTVNHFLPQLNTMHLVSSVICRAAIT